MVQVGARFSRHAAVPTRWAFSGGGYHAHPQRSAAVAVDVDGDGIPDYFVRGVDRDGDGIPDALQVIVQYTNVQTEKWRREEHDSIAMHTTPILSAVPQSQWMSMVMAFQITLFVVLIVMVMAFQMRCR